MLSTSCQSAQSSAEEAVARGGRDRALTAEALNMRPRKPTKWAQVKQATAEARVGLKTEGLMPAGSGQVCKAQKPTDCCRCT